MHCSSVIAKTLYTKTFNFHCLYCIYISINHGDPSYQLYCSLHRHPRGLLHCIYLVLQVWVFTLQLFVEEIDRFHRLIFIILDIQWQSHKYFWYFQITGEDSSEQADSGLGGGGECCSRYHNREAVDNITPSDDLHFAHRRPPNLCITCWTWSRPQSGPRPPWSAAWPAASRTSSNLQKRVTAAGYAF